MGYFITFLLGAFVGISIMALLQAGKDSES